MSRSSNSTPGFLARNTVWNIAGQVIPLAAFATIPYVVRGLGPERFGILSIAWLVLGYFALLDFGLGRAATKFLAECLARRQFEKLPGLVWTSLGLQIAMGCVGGLLLALLTPVLVGKVFHVGPKLEGEARRVFSILVLSLPVVLATNGLRAVLEAAQRFDLVNFLRIPASIAVYLLPACGLWLGLNLPEIVLLLVGARAVTSLAYLVCCFHVLPTPGLHLAWSREALIALVRYGGWVTVSNLVNPVLVYVDRFFIGSLLSLSLLGAYTVPFEAVTKLWIVPASLASSLFPAFSGLGAAEDQSRLTLLFARSFKYLLLFLGPVALVLALFAREVLTAWMGAGFAGETSAVLQILACGVFVNCFAHIPFGLLQSRGRPDLAAKILLIELPMYLPLAWFFVRSWGIQGAAAAWTIRVALEAVALAFFASRAFAIAPRSILEHGALKGLIGIAALGSGLAAAKLLFRGNIPAESIAAMALIAGYCGLVWHKVLDRADRGQVQGMLAPVFNPVSG
jgi:O-antigen/teichoic acid export membrane protein